MIAHSLLRCAADSKLAAVATVNWSHQIMAPNQPVDGISEGQVRQACAELDRRLRDGEPIRAEQILATLGADTDTEVELVYTEYSVREELGEQPSIEEYFERFPTLREKLRRQFAIHSLLGGSDSTIDPRHKDETGSGGGVAANVEQRPPLTRLGRYEVFGELGRGAAGAVFRAHQDDLERDVALKVVFLGPHADDE